MPRKSKSKKAVFKLPADMSASDAVKTLPELQEWILSQYAAAQIKLDGEMEDVSISTAQVLISISRTDFPENVEVSADIATAIETFVSSQTYESRT